MNTYYHPISHKEYYGEHVDEPLTKEKIINSIGKKKIESIKGKLKETAKIINKKTFTFNKESKENGELYGSIKPKEISTEIFNKMKIEVKPSQIVLRIDINKIGEYKVDIKTSWHKIPKNIKNIILYGDENNTVNFLLYGISIHFSIKYLKISLKQSF